jgi:hypothetical protein
MDKTTLVAPDSKTADEILELLKAAKFPVTVAAWVLSRELGGWQFVIGTPLYDKLGGREAYGRLIAAIRASDPASVLFEDVRLMSNRNPFIRDVRRAFEGRGFRRGVGMAGLIGDMWVDEARFYYVK